MSESHLELNSKKLARAQLHTHASQLLQQPQQHQRHDQPARSPVKSRPHTSACQRETSAARLAIATLPASTGRTVLAFSSLSRSGPYLGLPSGATLKGSSSATTAPHVRDTQLFANPPVVSWQQASTTATSPRSPQQEIQNSSPQASLPAFISRPVESPHMSQPQSRAASSSRANALPPRLLLHTTITTSALQVLGSQKAQVDPLLQKFATQQKTQSVPGSIPSSKPPTAAKPRPGSRSASLTTPPLTDEPSQGLCGNFLTSSKPLDFKTMKEMKARYKPIEVLANWSSDLFSPQKYEELNPGLEEEGITVVVCDLLKGLNQRMPLSDFLDHCQRERQYSPQQREKLYGNSLPCPPEWTNALARLVHPRLEYHGDQDASVSLAKKARSTTQKCYFGPGSKVVILTLANLLPKDPHPNELADAPFPFYCYQQKLGNLVLIPPRALHMILNTGGRTMKVAWSRLTVESLASALFADLPLYQRICRVKGLNVKPIVEATLIKCTNQVESNLIDERKTTSKMIRKLRGLLQLYDAVLTDKFIPGWPNCPIVGDSDSYIECDFCGADILHGYFECPAGETLCSLCYCQGRLCGCADATKALEPRQHWRSFGERLEICTRAARVLLQAQPSLASPPDLPKEAEDGGSEHSDPEPPLRQVEILTKDDLAKKTWPFSFMAALQLYNIRRQSAEERETLAPCRICKAIVDLSQRYYCAPCRQSFCYGCLLHRSYIHPVHALAQQEPEWFHRYHRKDSMINYKEWKQDPLEFTDEARAHFVLIEAARINMKCAPINRNCRIGFLDVSDEHLHGLSGTLGVKQSKKAATDRIKSTSARSSSSSTPVSHKRQSNVVQPPSDTTPIALTNKKAKPNPSANAQPMEEDELADQISFVTIPEENNMPVLDAAPVSLPKTATSSLLSLDVSLRSKTEEKASSSALTVANGIRKFVLRAGKIQPVSPSSTAFNGGPSPLPGAFQITTPTCNKHFETGSSASTVAAPPVSASLAHSAAAPATVPAGVSFISNTTVRASLSKASKATQSIQPTSADVTSPSFVTTGSAPSASASKSATMATSAASAPRHVITTPAVPAVGIQAAKRQRQVTESVALATSAVAAEIASRPPQPANISAESSDAGLGALDNMNLRIITEVLRIFSQSNQKMISGQVEEIKKVHAKQAEEHQEALVRQAEEHRQAMSKMEAKLQNIERLVQHQDKRMRTVLQRIERSDEGVKEIESMLGGLMEDVNWAAQLELEGELGFRSSLVL
ncbi:uncharacterized protein MEPE_02991 [Melanopsichium pennsylvanicum]|uniref:C-module-binding factor n=1 Tax=Melanopsichium pennsylvanicum TaxID=63383 RepID=A0AAJ5C576_9BASI|nr:uncharacterized protein MEPE_02991 [Melanopsichium pennsylvanicum]